MTKFKYFQKKGNETQVEDPMKKNEKDNDVCKQEVSELKDKLYRSLAEFENFRKRKIKDVQDAKDLQKRNTIEEFLTVYDHFQMAMKSVENGDNLEIVRQGMVMIFNEFGKVFENLGVEKIDAIGKPFNPETQEAISYQTSDEIAKDFVVQQWKSGYKMGDKLLRPATVVVSSGKPKEEKPEEN